LIFIEFYKISLFLYFWGFFGGRGGEGGWGGLRSASRGM
jgi:hypothetical protein